MATRPERRTIDALLAGNREWADEVGRSQPEFFGKLARGQEPPFLYIGCADSRVPPDHFTGCEPGNLFVTRNVANQVRADDLALNSVVSYAVGVLEVEHVIVCGHTGCGGVIAAMSGKRTASDVDAWIAPLRSLVTASETELEDLQGAARIDRVVELNVRQQVSQLAELVPMRKAWESGHHVDIHGWVFDLTNGRVRELVHLAPPVESNGAPARQPKDMRS